MNKRGLPIAYLIAAAVVVAVAVWTTMGSPLPSHPVSGVMQKASNR
jgi:hypothetical protein